MTPTHAVKNGTRYRYYVSRPLITGARVDAAAGLRLPAAEIEQIVVNRVRRLLAEPARLFEIFAAQAGEPMLQQSLMARAAKLAEEWARMSPLRMRVILLALVQRVDIGPDEVIVHLRPRRLAALLDDHVSPASAGPVDDGPTLPLSHPVQLRRAGKEVRMVIDHTDPFAPPAKPDPSLIKAIVNAHRFNEQLLHCGAGKFADLAKTRETASILLQPGPPPRLPRPRHHRRHPRRTTAPRPHRDDADRAPAPAAELAGAANRTRLRLSRNHDPITVTAHRGRSRCSSLSSPKPRRRARCASTEFRQCINARQRYSGPMAHSTAAARLSPTRADAARAATPGKGVRFRLQSPDAKI